MSPLAEVTQLSAPESSPACKLTSVALMDADGEARIVAGRLGKLDVVAIDGVIWPDAATMEVMDENASMTLPVKREESNIFTLR